MIAAGALIVIETRDLAQIDPAEQRPHVIDGVDRHALAADLADRQRRVGVVAHQRRHVERGRKPRLAVVEQVAEALVGLLGGAEAGELAHRPQPAAVHRGVDAAREGVAARQADLRRVGQVGLGVQRPYDLIGERRELGVALGCDAVGVEPLGVRGRGADR